MEEEKIKKIAELREIIEARMKILETELEGMRKVLDFVNTLLVEKSFKRAEEIAGPTKLRSKTTKIGIGHKQVTKTMPLRTNEGLFLANFHIDNEQIRIVPNPEIKFNVNMPPFKAFLIERIYDKMLQTDQELIRLGKLEANRAFSHQIEKDGDTLKVIVIRNFTQNREEELRSATRWTLEKMYEKIQGES